MGQTIEINGSRLIGDVLVIDTDRSLAGQDGEAFTPETRPTSDTFPALLAGRLLEADGDIERVHVMSNAVSLSRSGGWTDEAVATAHDIIVRFFEYY